MKWFAIPVAALAAVLASAISLGSTGAKPGTPTPQGLFSHDAGSKPRVLPQRAYRKNARGVRLNRDKLRRGTFFVDLPDAVSFEAVREYQHEMSDDKFAWVGHARGNPGNRAVLGVSGDAVAGTFAYGGRLFKLEPRADGTHVVSEVSPRDPAPELDPVPVFDPTAFDAPGQGTATVATSDAGGAVIDVMVAYTPAALAIYGEQGIEALIIQAVAETNQGYANSGMSTRLNLVGTALTDYTTSGDMLTDLGRLRHTSDGYMDELHTLRNELGADLVSLIDKQSGYCGLAYRMTGLSPFFASSAFSVVNHSCATGYFSFGHELGHNQGVHHDPETAAGSNAVFPYAFGYQDPLGDFRTIMAYNCPGGCVRINHFSNPDILFNGAPTGVASQSDNARAIDETAAVVANFRQSVAVAQPPARPTDLTAQVLADNSIALNWFDNAEDETGYYLERATGESPYSQVASLPAGASAFTDTGLAPGVTYTYRVRAWNGSGVSGFSNTASGWIEQDVFVDRYPIYGGGWAHTTGDWSDSGATDGQMLTVEELSADDYTWLAASLMEYYWVVDVEPGETVTIHTDAYTESLDQVFTFAYSTSLERLGHAEDAWVDMFIVSPWFPGELKFTLPEGISGLVFISARDSNRVKNEGSRDRLHIDSLYVRTENPGAPAP